MRKFVIIGSRKTLDPKLETFVAGFCDDYGTAKRVLKFHEENAMNTEYAVYRRVDFAAPENVEEKEAPADGC